MNRDQYINEVRRKSLVILFNAARRIIAHPLNRTSYGELRAAGCTALDYAAEGKVPRYITGTGGYRDAYGATVLPTQRTSQRWLHEVQSEACAHWADQRPTGASGYWWYMEISMGAAQYRLRAIDNIIKDLTPAAVSRNKREGKFVGRDAGRCVRVGKCTRTPRVRSWFAQCVVFLR